MGRCGVQVGVCALLVTASALTSASSTGGAAPPDGRATAAPPPAAPVRPAAAAAEDCLPHTRAAHAHAPVHSGHAHAAPAHSGHADAAHARPVASHLRMAAPHDPPPAAPDPSGDQQPATAPSSAVQGDAPPHLAEPPDPFGDDVPDDAASAAPPPAVGDAAQDTSGQVSHGEVMFGGGLFPDPVLGAGTPLLGRDPEQDRAALTADQAAALLAELGEVLFGRYGTTDEAAALRAERRAGPITVPVRFHVIADGREGRLSRETAVRQIATLNAAYSGRRGAEAADTGVRFRLAGFEVTDNAAWFRSPDRHERRMKSALHKGGAGTLNLYTAAVGVKVLGFSTYPQSYRERPVEDGVVVDYRSLPGGAYRNYSHGYTAVHEVGHWLGLFHTFENGCDSPGDGVGDTPYEAVPTEGCPVSKDTCWASGPDPIHNFMDYAWDACMREFTAGQGRRIRASWAAFRASSDR